MSQLTKCFNTQILHTTEIYFILQSNGTRYNKSFKFILFSFNSDYLIWHHILSSEILGRTFTDRFEECSNGYIFSNPAIYRMGDVPNVLCPRCKELFNFRNSCFSTAAKLGSKETFWKNWNLLLSNNGNLIIQFSQFSPSLLQQLHYQALMLIHHCPPYSHRFKRLIYTKTSTNLYHLLIYTGSLLVAFRFSSFTDQSSCKRSNLDIKIL